MTPYFLFRLPFHHIPFFASIYITHFLSPFPFNALYSIIFHCSIPSFLCHQIPPLTTFLFASPLYKYSLLSSQFPFLSSLLFFSSLYLTFSFLSFQSFLLSLSLYNSSLPAIPFLPLSSHYLSSTPFLYLESSLSPLSICLPSKQFPLISF
jgi:hypothetical protein